MKERFRKQTQLGQEHIESSKPKMQKWYVAPGLLRFANPHPAKLRGFLWEPVDTSGDFGIGQSIGIQYTIELIKKADQTRHHFYSPWK